MKFLVVAALSLLVHAKGLRAPLLDYHFHREVNTASIARNYWREDRPFHKPRIDWNGPEDRMAATELPVYMWLYGKLWPVGGIGEGWGRLISVAASLATALLLLGFFSKEFGPEAGFWGAAVFTVIPVEAYFGRTVQPEALALLAMTASYVLWDKSLERGRPWPAWAGAVFCAFIAVGLKLPYAHLLVPLFGLTWRRLGNKTWTDWRMHAAGLVSMGGVIAWYLWARTGVYVVPTHAGEYTNLLAYDRILYFIQFQITSRWLELVATYGGAVFLYFGFKERIVQMRDAFWIAWFGGTALHLFAMSGYSHFHEYTALPMAPVFAGLIGLGIVRLRERAAGKPLALAGIAVLVLAIPVHSALRIGHWYKQGFEYLGGAGKAAAAVSKPDDLFFTNCQASSVLLYYLDRRGWSTELDLDAPAEQDELLGKAVAGGARFIASEKRGVFAEDGAMWKRFRAKGKPVWDDGKLVIFRL